MTGEPTKRLPSRLSRRTERTPIEAHGQEQEESDPSSGRDLPIAIVSGLALVAGFLGTLLWHPAAFTVLVTLMVLFGLAETARVCRQHQVPVATPVALLAALVLLIGAYRAGSRGQLVGLVTLVVGAVVWELADPQRRHVFRKVAATVLLGLWIAFFGSFAVLLVTRPRDGWVAVLATVGVAIVGDIGAYAVGSRFGRHNLAPTVSPGKTWEGVLGGLAFAALLAALTLPLLGELFSPAGAVAFALMVGVAGVVGDLTESMFKRDLGVKDFGAVIPGHGGVLDRIDAILFALPTGYYMLALVGR